MPVRNPVRALWALGRLAAIALLSFALAAPSAGDTAAEARADSDAAASAASAPARAREPEPAPAGWVAPQDAGFRALFPEPPRYQEHEQSTLLGTLRTQSWEVDRGALRLRVERHELPGLALIVLGGESLLARAERSLVEDIGARALEAEAITDAGGHPSRVLRYEPGDRPGEREEARLTLVGRVIFVTFARPRAGADAAARAAADRFESSLEILGTGALAAR